MTTSDNGISLIKRSEGFAATPYEDNGKMAWGYGHDQQHGEPMPASVTLDEADKILRTDLATRFEPILNGYLISKAISATQNQYDALIDFAYNLGTGSLLTMLAHGWYQVPVQMLRWNHVDGVANAGLGARRQAEVNLWEQA